MRELLLLQDALPKDADVHDGLQLGDGGDPSRHRVESEAIVPAAPFAPAAPSASAAAVPAVVGGAPNGVVLPVPQQPMRLEPLPSHLPGRSTPPAGGQNSMPGAGQNEPDDDCDEEEDDEIRPVSDERAAQWRAYRAARF